MDHKMLEAYLHPEQMKKIYALMLERGYTPSA